MNLRRTHLKKKSGLGFVGLKPFEGLAQREPRGEKLHRSLSGARVRPLSVSLRVCFWCFGAPEGLQGFRTRGLGCRVSGIQACRAVKF